MKRIGDSSVGAVIVDTNDALAALKAQLDGEVPKSTAQTPVDERRDARDPSVNGGPENGKRDLAGAANLVRSSVDTNALSEQRRGQLEQLTDGWPVPLRLAYRSPEFRKLAAACRMGEDQPLQEAARLAYATRWEAAYAEPTYARLLVGALHVTNATDLVKAANIFAKDPDLVWTTQLAERVGAELKPFANSASRASFVGSLAYAIQLDLEMMGPGRAAKLIESCTSRARAAPAGAPRSPAAIMAQIDVLRSVSGDVLDKQVPKILATLAPYDDTAKAEALRQIAEIPALSDATATAVAKVVGEIDPSLVGTIASADSIRAGNPNLLDAVLERLPASDIERVAKLLPERTEWPQHLLATLLLRCAAVAPKALPTVALGLVNAFDPPSTALSTWFIPGTVRGRVGMIAAPTGLTFLGVSATGHVAAAAILSIVSGCIGWLADDLRFVLGRHDGRTREGSHRTFYALKLARAIVDAADTLGLRDDNERLALHALVEERFAKNEFYDEDQRGKIAAALLGQDGTEELPTVSRPKRPTSEQKA